MLAFGINHKTASIDLREQVAVNQDKLASALQSLSVTSQSSEVALLSTCNRTEIYTADLCPKLLSEWFRDYHELPEHLIQSISYSYHDQAAVRHIMRVASGLDSMVLGEPQILGQVKQAYFTAKSQGVVGKILQRLFETTFSVAKLVRSDTDIGKSPISLAYVAIKMASQIFSDLSKVTVLLIGAGEMIELCARHLQEQRVSRFLVANRTIGRAQDLANRLGGHALSLEGIHDTLHQADVIIAATGSSIPILGKGSIESALRMRKRKPVFMVDLGMPRNIEPEAASLEDVYLYAVDDLQAIITDNVKMRYRAAEQAEVIISQQADKFMAWLRGQSSVEMIREYRAQSELQRDHAVQQALQLLAKGMSAEEVIKRLAYQLTNQLIHDPTVALREMAEAGENDGLLAAKQLLGMLKHQ